MFCDITQREASMEKSTGGYSEDTNRFPQKNFKNYFFSQFFFKQLFKKKKLPQFFFFGGLKWNLKCSLG
jgi:hypothetical protein